MSRWVRIQADVFDHPIFADEPFSEREAWLWLIAKAAWKDTFHRVGTTIVEVPAGSLFITLRQLQAAWKWRSDTRVRRFLRVLADQRMIRCEINAGKTQISICNYEKFQNSQRTENAEKTHGKRTENALKTPVHQDTNSSSLRSEEPRERANGEFDEFWSIYPHKIGKPKAREAFLKARKRAGFDVIMAGLRAYVAKTDDRPWCNPATWLNQDRWEDIPAPMPQRQAAAPPSDRSRMNETLDLLIAGANHEPDHITIDASLHGSDRRSPKGPVQRLALPARD